MCMTEYLSTRAQELEVIAQGKIDVLDYLITHVARAVTTAEQLPRAAGILALFLGMQADLTQEKAAAHRVIEDANALRQQAKDIPQ